MFVRDYPFTKTSPKDIARPYLPVTIINPHTKHELNVFALIDTGASDCALPASFAGPLGHVIEKGQVRTITTGVGETQVYCHSTLIKVFDFSTEVFRADFFQDLRIPLLGVKNFLSKFVLTINYPRKSFSIGLPQDNNHKE